MNTGFQTFFSRSQAVNHFNSNMIVLETDEVSVLMVNFFEPKIRVLIQQEVDSGVTVWNARDVTEPVQVPPVGLGLVI
jgi:hypothetical protein